MKKKLVAIVAIILVAATCLSVLVGCDGASNNVKYLRSCDFTGEHLLNVTMSKRLKKTFDTSADEISLMFDGSLYELCDRMQLEEGYSMTRYGDYALIETTVDGKLYTWGVFSSSIFGDEYLGSYRYVLTNMSVTIEGIGYKLFFFPIYTMERPLVVWEENGSYACSLTVDELSDFYTKQGCTTQILDNVLIVTTPTTKDYFGNEHSSSWEVTFHHDGTVSVGNLLQHDTIFD